jgi:hypothetical protein
MRVLSFKRFFMPKGTTISLNDIKAWFDSIDRGLDDCTLVVTLEATDGKRRPKKSALRQLEELVDNNVDDCGLRTLGWKQDGYLFFFPARKYYWNEKEIHVTANEQLFLYRWLVLHDDIRNTQRYYMWNMRKRLGKEFLAEVAE